MNGKISPGLLTQRLLSQRLVSQQRGFTLFEMVVVILLIGILMTFAIDRMLQLQISAERVSVQHVIGTLKSAVNLQAADLVVDKGVDAIRSLENTNPMQYLAEPLYNYIGIKSDSDADRYPLESWYYDPMQSVLVYKVRNTDYFSTNLTGTPRIRLRVVLIYKDESRRGRHGVVQGVSIRSPDDYEWKLN